MNNNTSGPDIHNRCRNSENILHWRFWFGEVDTRWLAIFRIAFSLLLLKDAVYHLFLARLFYSDEGVVPRWELFDGLVRTPRFSLMDAIGEPWLAIGFFLIWIVVLSLLALGYRTRWMTILNFIIILSVHERNGYVLTSADTLMRVMSFWMIFAPVGQYYSIDALRRRWGRFWQTSSPDQLRVETVRTAFEFPVRMMQLQLVMVYVVTAYLKTVSPIWTAGQAMHYVVQIDTFGLPMNAWMQTWPPEVLQLITYYTLFAEIAIPILLLLPIVWRWSRLLAFGFAIILHGGIAIALSIPDFSILMLLCYLPFFDPAWLKGLETYLTNRTEQVVLPAPDDLASPLWLFVSLIEPEQLRIADDRQIVNGPDAWVVRIQDETYTGVDAWRLLIGGIGFSRLWGWITRYQPVRYGLWWLGKFIIHRWQGRQFSWQPTMNLRASRIALTMFLLPLMTLVIWWNVETTTNYTQEIAYPPPVERFWNAARNIVWYTGLWQYWDMFSPTPIQYDGWITIPGQFENGYEYDLFTGRPLDNLTATRWYWGPFMRWEKFEENAYRWQYPALLRGWGSYYCRTLNVNRTRGTRLATLQIKMIYINFHAPDEDPGTYREELLWTHWCYDEYQPGS